MTAAFWVKGVQEAVLALTEGDDDDEIRAADIREVVSSAIEEARGIWAEVDDDGGEEDEEKDTDSDSGDGDGTASDDDTEDCRQRIVISRLPACLLVSLHFT